MRVVQGVLHGHLEFAGQRVFGDPDAAVQIADLHLDGLKVGGPLEDARRPGIDVPARGNGAERKIPLRDGKCVAENKIVSPCPVIGTDPPVVRAHRLAVAQRAAHLLLQAAGQRYPGDPGITVPIAQHDLVGCKIRRPLDRKRVFQDDRAAGGGSGKCAAQKGDFETLRSHIHPVRSPVPGPDIPFRRSDKAGIIAGIVAQRIGHVFSQTRSKDCLCFCHHIPFRIPSRAVDLHLSRNKVRLPADRAALSRSDRHIRRR